MATALDVITAALREIGVLAAGEVPSAAEGSDGLTALNNWLDQKAAERLTIYQVTRTLWTISANDGEYTVGASGNVNVARPTSIQGVSIIETATDPDYEISLGDGLTDDAYRGITQKALTSTLPRHWYYNATFPLGTLTLWPIPTSTTLQGALYAPQQITSFAALSTDVSLPPGYMRAMIKNLALDLSPSYGVQPSMLLVDQARESLATVKRSNIRPTELVCDAGALIQGARGTFDIRTGR
jgi:hypothetical protein